MQGRSETSRKGDEPLNPFPLLPALSRTEKLNMQHPTILSIRLQVLFVHGSCCEFRWVVLQSLRVVKRKNSALERARFLYLHQVLLGEPSTVKKLISYLT